MCWILHNGPFLLRYGILPSYHEQANVDTMRHVGVQRTTELSKTDVVNYDMQLCGLVFVTGAGLSNASVVKSDSVFTRIHRYQDGVAMASMQGQ